MDDAEDMGAVVDDAEDMGGKSWGKYMGKVRDDAEDLGGVGMNAFTVWPLCRNKGQRAHINFSRVSYKLFKVLVFFCSGFVSLCPGGSRC